MTTNGPNPHLGHDYHAHDPFPASPYAQGEPIAIQGFSVTYDRTFSLGDFESLNAAITIHLSREAPGDETFDLHHARERVRRMARENVRAQLLRQLGKPEVVFLGLQPPQPGTADPVSVYTVCICLVYQANLGKGQSFTTGYTDWADVRDVAHSPGELHMALSRMWQSLWANVEDEISRARGHGGTGGFFGLPTIPVEDLTKVPQTNDRFDTPNPVGPLSTGRIPVVNESRV